MIGTPRTHAAAADADREPTLDPVPPAAKMLTNVAFRQLICLVSASQP
jgi:hypothetical protein